MTDMIAQLREAWEKTAQGEWYADCDNVCDDDGRLVADTCTEHLTLDQDKAIAAFIALAHNKMPQVLAVLEAAEVLTYTGLPLDTTKNLGKLAWAVAALKGGSNGS